VSPAVTGAAILGANGVASDASTTSDRMSNAKSLPQFDVSGGTTMLCTAHQLAGELAFCSLVTAMSQGAWGKPTSESQSAVAAESDTHVRDDSTTWGANRFSS